MLRIRCLLAVSLFGGMSGIGAAQAEKAKPAPVSSVYELIGCIDDERLQKELKLSAEQVKKLLAERQRIWDAWYETPMQDWTKKRTTLHAGTAAVFKDSLDEAQFKRACELARQFTWETGYSNKSGFASLQANGLDVTRINPRILAEHRDLAEALQLSDDQHRLLTSDPVQANGRVIVLTAKQTKIASSLLGKLTPVHWAEKFDPRQSEITRDWFTYIPPGVLRITPEVHVKLELKLTIVQTDQLTKIQKQWAAIVSNPSRLSPAEAIAEINMFRRETEKTLEMVLHAEQLSRLRQLTVRAEHDPEYHVLKSKALVPSLALELGLSEEQERIFELIRTQYADAVKRAALTENGVEEAYKVIRASARDRDGDYIKALSPKQREKLQELIGPGPTVVLRPDGGKVGPSLRATTRETSFGHYSNELELLASNEDLRQELSLTADQIAIVNKLSPKPANPFGRSRAAGARPRNRVRHTRAPSAMLSRRFSTRNRPSGSVRSCCNLVSSRAPRTTLTRSPRPSRTRGLGRQ